MTVRALAVLVSGLTIAVTLACSGKTVVLRPIGAANSGCYTVVDACPRSVSDTGLKIDTSGIEVGKVKVGSAKIGPDVLQKVTGMYQLLDAGRQSRCQLLNGASTCDAKAAKVKAGVVLATECRHRGIYHTGRITLEFES